MSVGRGIRGGWWQWARWCVVAWAMAAHAADEWRFPTTFERHYRLEVRNGDGGWYIHEPAILGRGLEWIRPRSAFPPAVDDVRLVVEEVKDLGPTLEKVRAKHGVPALGAILIRSNRVVAAGVTGLRVAGGTDGAMLGDAWHHGSITKSMTATLAAMLVEEGKLRWDSTLGEVLGGKAPRMDEAWKAVTLSQLLRHRGGAPDHDQLKAAGTWDRIWRRRESAQGVRKFWLETVTAKAPVNPVGSKYAYSNTGYVFAGMMLETVAGEAWEELMKKRLFTPLGMGTAGFGAPGRPGSTNHPWGHQWVDDKPVGVPPGRWADNPPALGPAGTVHCSMFDLVKYLSLHALEGQWTGPVLLKPESVEFLHRLEPGERYALGWNVAHRSWAGGRTLNHTGSNTQWYSNVWIGPGKGFAILIVTNVGDGDGMRGFKVTDAAVARVVSEHLR